MNLPPIRPPSSCGTLEGTPGYVDFPEATDHHHDSRYYTKDEADCAKFAAFGKITGTPPPSVCTGCETLAGYVVGVDSDGGTTLQIVSYTIPAPGSNYPPPTVESVVVTGTDVVVTWGPDNNEASIGLAAIQAAIEASPEASALMRIVVCDPMQFVAFNEGLPVDISPFDLPAHTHLSADITNATYGGNGVADEYKVHKFEENGVLWANTLIRQKNPGGFVSEQSAANITANRTHILPNATGTYALVASTTGAIVPADIAWTATNDNATAGDIGEYVESVIPPGGAVTLTDASANNVTEIGLGAGDWDVEGVVTFLGAASTVTYRAAALSDTSYTLISDGRESADTRETVTTSETTSLVLTRKRVSLSTSATVNLVALAMFSAGAVTAYGSITARRVR